MLKDKKLITLFTISTILLILPMGWTIYHTQNTTHYTYQDLVWDGKSPTTPIYITKKQAQADINLLIYALHTAYGGKDFIDQNTFQQVLQKLRTIPLEDRVATKKFCENLDKILLELPDNHLHARRTKNNQSQMQPISCYSFEQNRMKLEKTPQIGHNTNTSQSPWLVKQLDHHKKNILLIALTSFPNSKSTQWHGFLAQVKAGLKNAQAIIIDLRDNIGGDSAMAENLAKILYHSNELPDPVEAVYFKNTPEAYTIHANLYKVQLEIALLQQNKKDATHLQKHYDQLLQKAQLAKQKNIPKHHIRKRPFVPTPKNIVKKPIVILMNKQCRSSGEVMIDLMEAHPYFITIGTNTKGGIHFGNVGCFILKHSQIFIQMPCQYRAYRDSRFIERIGITPHIQVPDGKDAWHTALELLNNKL